jgi:4-hydroxyphenylpyruvate dioxygenase-like putative hemolysin
MRDTRKSLGLEGLVGGLDSVIINTEPDRQKSAVEELLRYTGFEFEAAYETDKKRVCVLKRRDSANILVTSRSKGENPFVSFNIAPKSGHLPNTRLETFVFEISNIEKYVSIQKNREIEFVTPHIIETDTFSFIQTKPSELTGNSVGLIQWKKQKGNYFDEKARDLKWEFTKPEKDYLDNIGKIDHAATRIEAQNRDTAIIEFMSLTNYNFDFAIYVKVFNSITNVARLTKTDFAMVFTSGISPYIDAETSGPTERYIHNYGPRVHHVAYKTENIEDTFAEIKNDGMKFLIDLVGSKNQGLKQTFTVGSPNTLLVNEYIHRYGDFDGFFTKNNVTLLTAATQKQ